MLFCETHKINNMSSYQPISEKDGDCCVDSRWRSCTKNYEKMNHSREFLVIVSFLLLVGCSSVKQDHEKPNFLFIVVDDLGYYDLSCMGSEYYETPNIDKVASEGYNFINGYATCAVCSPSRASLLTGKYPAQHGITDWVGARSGANWRKNKRYTKLLPASYKHHLSNEETTLAEALKENGYNTFFAGKWHLGGENEKSLPTDHGFDINIGGYHAGGPYPGGYFSPFNNPYMTDYENEKGMSLSMKLAKETSAFIRKNKDSEFLAYLSFYAVHSPIETSENKWKKYRNKADSIGIHKNGFEMERILPIRKYQDNPVYAGLIEQVDDAIGSVLETLKELYLDKNTIVIFTSDNGGVASGDNYSTSNLPFRGGKGYQWEGGIRVPYFIYVPWLNSNGAKNNTPVTGADFYPTILELAGIKMKFNTTIDGVSLMPLLMGDNIKSRPLFWHYPHYGNQGGEPNSTIIENEWKLIHYWEGGRDELYNLKTDVSEEKNIADKHPEIVTTMRKQIMEWLNKTSAKFPMADSLFNNDSLNIKLQYYKDELLPKLEKKRKLMLSKDWQPNNDWWGSKSKKSE